MNNNNMNQGQPNNFNPNMNQPNNNFKNNNNQMMNQNIQNQNNNNNNQAFNQGSQSNNQNDDNIIQKICFNNLQNNDAPKVISNDLKNQMGGEWFVAIAEYNDNYEFNILDIPLQNFKIYQIQQKIVYICKYV